MVTAMRKREGVISASGQFASASSGVKLRSAARNQKRLPSRRSRKKMIKANSGCHDNHVAMEMMMSPQSRHTTTCEPFE
jgi:superoxide dismutase